MCDIKYEVEDSHNISNQDEIEDLSDNIRPILKNDIKREIKQEYIEEEINDGELVDVNQDEYYINKETYKSESKFEQNALNVGKDYDVQNIKSEIYEDEEVEYEYEDAEEEENGNDEGDNALKNVKHVCNQCDKSFTTRNYLKKHIKIIHDGIKKWKCEYCPKAFSERNNLRRHVERLHEGNAPTEKCEYCDKVLAGMLITRQSKFIIHT